VDDTCTGASKSTLTTSLKTEQADKSEQTPELQRKDRRASPSLRSSRKERHGSRTRQETGHDDDCNGESATARRRTAQSTRSTERRRARSKSTTSRELRGRLRWDDLDYTATETKAKTSGKLLFPEQAVDAPYRIGHRSPYCELRARPPLRTKGKQAPRRGAKNRRQWTRKGPGAR